MESGITNQIATNEEVDINYVIFLVITAASAVLREIFSSSAAGLVRKIEQQLQEDERWMEVNGEDLEFQRVPTVRCDRCSWSGRAMKTGSTSLSRGGAGLTSFFSRDPTSPVT